MFVRRGIAEKDEDGIPETGGDIPAVAPDDLRDAVLEGADRFEQILETDPVGSRRHADRFGRHDGDLPTFGLIMLSVTDPRNQPIGRQVVRHLGGRAGPGPIGSDSLSERLVAERGGAGTTRGSGTCCALPPASISWISPVNW